MDIFKRGPMHTYHDDFDIFRKSPDGSLFWMESARDLDAADGRIMVLAANKPGEYVVFCQSTQRIVATNRHCNIDIEANA
jgi:hypothetical protein